MNRVIVALLITLSISSANNVPETLNHKMNLDNASEVTNLIMIQGDTLTVTYRHNPAIPIEW